MHGMGGGVHGAGDVHGRGVCVTGGHAWQGMCVAGDVCGAGGMDGRGCVAGGCQNANIVSMRMLRLCRECV